MSLLKALYAICISCAVFVSMIAGYHYFIMLPTFSKYEKTFYIVDFEQLSAVRAMDTIVKQSRGEIDIKGVADIAKIAEQFREDFKKALGELVGKAPVFAKNTVVSSENFTDLTLPVADRLGLVIDEAKLKDILFATTAKQRGLTDIQLPEKLIDEKALDVFSLGPDGQINYNNEYLLREYGITAPPSDSTSSPQRGQGSLNFEKFEQ